MLGNLFDRLASRAGGGDDRPPGLIEAWMPRPPMDVALDLPYGGQPRRRLDLYLPRDPVAARRRLVMVVYGGGWSGGSRRTYRFLAHMLAACGFAVAVPDYRLFPQVRFPGFVEDTAMAAAWLHRHGRDHGLDGANTRLALLGHSAGAYNAALVALDPSYLERQSSSPAILAGVVGLAGPYAFNPLEWEETKPIFAPAETNPDQARPVTFARAGAPPMLLAHGLADRRVLPANSRELAAALSRAGGEAALRLYPRYGHVGILLALAAPFRRVSRVFRDTLGFLDRVLPAS